MPAMEYQRRSSSAARRSRGRACLLDIVGSDARLPRSRGHGALPHETHAAHLALHGVERVQALIKVHAANGLGQDVAAVNHLVWWNRQQARVVSAPRGGAAVCRFKQSPPHCLGA